MVEATGTPKRALGRGWKAGVGVNNADPGDENAADRGVGERTPLRPLLELPFRSTEGASSDEKVGSLEC